MTMIPPAPAAPAATSPPSTGASRSDGSEVSSAFAALVSALNEQLVAGENDSGDGAVDTEAAEATVDAELVDGAAANAVPFVAALLTDAVTSPAAEGLPGTDAAPAPTVAGGSAAVAAALEGEAEGELTAESTSEMGEELAPEMDAEVSESAGPVADTEPADTEPADTEPAGEEIAVEQIAVEELPADTDGLEAAGPDDPTTAEMEPSADTDLTTEAAPDANTEPMEHTDEGVEPVPGATDDHAATGDLPDVADAPDTVPAPVAPAPGTATGTPGGAAAGGNATAPTATVDGVAPSAGVSAARTAPPPPADQVVTVLTPLRSGPDGTHRISMQLRPDELGEVLIDVRVRGNEISLNLRTDLAGTADLLRSSLAELRADLEEAGFHAGDLDVSDHGADAGVDDRNDGRSGSAGGRQDSDRPGSENLTTGPTTTASGLDLRL